MQILALPLNPTHNLHPNFHEPFWAANGPRTALSTHYPFFAKRGATGGYIIIKFCSPCRDSRFSAGAPSRACWCGRCPAAVSRSCRSASSRTAGRFSRPHRSSGRPRRRVCDTRRTFSAVGAKKIHMITVLSTRPLRPSRRRPNNAPTTT